MKINPKKVTVKVEITSLFDKRSFTLDTEYITPKYILRVLEIKLGHFFQRHNDILGDEEFKHLPLINRED